jgi:Flp pilus assembly protein TadD
MRRSGVAWRADAVSLALFPLLVFGTLIAYQQLFAPTEEHLREAASRFERGDLVAAARSYQAALEVQPDNHRIITQLGVVRVAQQRRAEAAVLFESALRLAPDNLQARKLLATQQRHLAAVAAQKPVTDSSSDQFALLEQALQVSPEDGHTYAAIANAWHRVGVTEEARTALEHAAALEPSSGATLHNLGVLQLSAGHVDRARASFEAASQSNPRNLAAHFMLAATRPRSDTAAAERLHERVQQMAIGESDDASDVVNAHYTALARNLLGGSVTTPDALAGATASFAAHTTDGAAGESCNLLESLERDGYAVCDGVLGHTQQQRLQLAAAELSPRMRHGSVGQPTLATHRMEGTAARSDQVVRFGATSRDWHEGLSAGLLDGIKALRGMLYEQLHPLLLHARSSDAPPLWPQEQMQFACYAPGAFYTAHEDVHPGQRAGESASESGVERIFTAIYYTAPGARVAGGALRLWPAGSYQSIELHPVGDRLIVFASSLTHEVMPVTLEASLEGAQQDQGGSTQERERGRHGSTESGSREAGRGSGGVGATGGQRGSGGSTESGSREAGRRCAFTQWFSAVPAQR